MLILLISVLAILAIFFMARAEGDNPGVPLVIGLGFFILALFLSFIGGWGKSSGMGSLDNGTLYHIEYVRQSNDSLEEMLIRRASDQSLFFVERRHNGSNPIIQGGSYVFVDGGFFGSKVFKPINEK